MIIENGLQPNCSELIIRLGDVERDFVTEELVKIGIKEYFVKNKYEWNKEPTEWDDEDSSTQFFEASKFPKKVIKAYDTMNYGLNQEAVNRATAILEESGLKTNNVSLDLIDGEPKRVQYAPDIHIERDPYDGDELAIWYNQHCQPQGFPTLKKIAEHLGSEVEAHDGGSIEPYESWENGEEPEDE